MLGSRKSELELHFISSSNRDHGTVQVSRNGIKNLNFGPTFKLLMCYAFKKLIPSQNVIYFLKEGSCALEQ